MPKKIVKVPFAEYVKKKAHIDVSSSEVSQVTQHNMLDSVRFVHNALPEINFSDIDLSANFFGKAIAAPFFIASMSGGIKEGQRLNELLAISAQQHNIPFCLGSLKLLVEDATNYKHFNVRPFAPDIPIFGNIGATYLKTKQARLQLLRVLEKLQCDGCYIHLNPMQEVFQKGGDTDWKFVAQGIASFIKEANIPVIVKEVGHAISVPVAKRLISLGVKTIDIAAQGGTSWIKVESLINQDLERQKTDEPFYDWGQDLVTSLIDFQHANLPIDIVASGGVRNGLDVAKSLALGAKYVSAAYPFLRAAQNGEQALDNCIDGWKAQLKIAMFGVGIDKIDQLNSHLLRV